MPLPLIPAIVGLGKTLAVGAGAMFVLPKIARPALAPAKAVLTRAVRFGKTTIGGILGHKAVAVGGGIGVGSALAGMGVGVGVRAVARPFVPFYRDEKGELRINWEVLGIILLVIIMFFVIVKILKK